MAAPLGVGVERHVERGDDVVGAEPVGGFADGGGVGVVEVMASGEDFDGGGAGLREDVEKSWGQAAREKDVGRDSLLHPIQAIACGGGERCC